MPTKPRSSSPGSVASASVWPVLVAGAFGFAFLPDAAAQIAFEDVSIAAGFGGTGSESWGAAWGDLDGDHYPDLFCGNHRVRASLHRNNRDGTFTNVSDLVDLSRTPGWTGGRADVDTHGAGWVDIDNDGDDDLYESVSSSDDNLYINDGGYLTNRNLAYGLDLLGHHATRQNLFLDFNGDGLLDLASIALHDSAFAPQLPNGRFGHGPGVEIPISCSEEAQWAHLADVHPTPGLELLCAPRTELYPKSVNAFANGEVVDVTAGFPRYGPVNDAVTLDFNRDLRPDIFMVRGPERRSDAYQSAPDRFETQFVTAPKRTKSVRFKSTGVLTVTASLREGHGDDPQGLPEFIDIGAGAWSPDVLTFNLSPADSRNAGIQTGSPGINVGYLAGTREWLITQGNDDYSYSYLQVKSTAAITNIRFTGSSATDIGQTPILLENTTDRFVQVSAAGLNVALRCQSAVAGDFDNDMDEDLFLACTGGSYNLPNRLFVNEGNGTFTEMPSAAGAAGKVGAAVADQAGTSESVVMADYDLDGFLDLLVTNGNNMRPLYVGGPKQLFHNRGNSNHWIELDLVGTTSNRDGQGSLVYVTAGGTTQYREQNGGYHRWSQNFRRLHVGLGQNTSADVRVQWPDGSETNYASLASNTMYQVRQDGTVTPLTTHGGVGGTDTDGDGLSDERETSLATDPSSADTDLDGLDDGVEVNVHGTNPLAKDSDKDRLSDRVEILFKRTNPLNPDTDGDGLTDGREASANGLGTNPLRADTDSGGVNDGVEVARGTNPRDPADDAP
jgi:hypothetical protein